MYLKYINENVVLFDSKKYIKHVLTHSGDLYILTDTNSNKKYYLKLLNEKEFIIERTELNQANVYWIPEEETQKVYKQYIDIKAMREQFDKKFDKYLELQREILEDEKIIEELEK